MLIEIIFIFFFTLILVGLLVPVGRYGSHRTRLRGERIPDRDEADAEEFSVGLTMLFFFLLLFPLILAGNYWVTPYGPTFMDISWMPIVIIGAMLALMIAAVSPRSSSATRRATGAEDAMKVGVAALFSFTYVLLLIVAVSLIIAALI